MGIVHGGSDYGNSFILVRSHEWWHDRDDSLLPSRDSRTLGAQAINDGAPADFGGGSHRVVLEQRDHVNAVKDVLGQQGNGTQRLHVLFDLFGRRGTGDDGGDIGVLGAPGDGKFSK